MFLKSLTMKGFKSFADATQLDLEPGVTVVVGPNGSGKSNVVDAVAWVLGAQAPSAVRSQKMDDVIFAGTAKRPALGRAEVSLTIDNSDGVLPIEFTEVTVTRVLFRSGDSEYMINGAPCRLLDIQELLSDAGVGRQQHVIVSQGQIDQVLNARPEDRRMIIEEAAGVLKYRKRKEKAERRLNSTEANLTRVQDLLREVRRQLRPLERQADAARRHGDLVDELHALQVFVAGQQLARLHTQTQSQREKRNELVVETRQVKDELARLDTAVATAESQLSTQGGADIGDALVRYESIRERSRGLVAVLEQRRQGISRDRDAFVDQAVVATLESESARLRSDLDEVEREALGLKPDAERVRLADAELAGLRESFEKDWAEGVEPPTGRAAEVRGELGALSASVERAVAERSRLSERITQLEQVLGELDGKRTELVTTMQSAESDEEPLVEAITALEAQLASATEAAEAVNEEAALAERELNAGQARIEALQLALDEARTAAGIESLAGIDGVLGTLVELVDVDNGFEAAFEAAVGPALAGIVVEGDVAARRALSKLSEEDLGGEVLIAAAPAAASGASNGGLRARVRALRPGLDELLDRLLLNVDVVDGEWTAALDQAIASPGRVVVTREGDRFGPGGWRLGAGGAGATKGALDDAEAAVAVLMERLTELRDRQAQAKTKVGEAKAEHNRVGQQLDATDSRMVAATERLERLARDQREATVELESLQVRVAELTDRSDRDQQRVAELQSSLPEFEAAEQAVVEKGKAMNVERMSLDERAAAVSSLRTDLEVRAAAVEERRSVLRSRLTDVDAKLVEHAESLAEVEATRLKLDRREAIVKKLASVVENRLGTIEFELDDIRERRRKQSETQQAIATNLDSLRKQRNQLERRLEQLRELTGRVELEQTEVKLRVEAAVESLRRDLDIEPGAALEAQCPELAEGVKPAARVRDLERELKVMGPINPLALQEFEQLQERHEFLQSQLDDVRGTRRDLAKVIRSIDEEIVNVFASAFADVSQNFEHLFGKLFPGGVGRIRLTMPNDPLNTGIEIEAKPSGKNVKKLSLLSGGERTLVAMGFLFAVFRSRPSPFYVMDEVEAALDDVNLHRFLELVKEFRDEAQLLIVSHQKRTMEAGDILYGVSMQPGGSSRVVSEKVKSDDRVGAPAAAVPVA